MSSAMKEEDEVMLCASCGKAEIDDIKLKKCTACHLVRYCSVKCQRDHRPKHKKECNKRAAELKDELLFKQPQSSHFGDCPLCCVPLSLDKEKSAMYTCCSKHICQGCDLTNQFRELDGRLQRKCPFCRKDLPKTQDESTERLMKRVEANDPVAIRELGVTRAMEGDYESAFEYYSKALALGDADAHYHLSMLYYKGQGVEKNEKKFLHHTEQAAIGGHPEARHNLGSLEKSNGRIDRAVKHYVIAAKLGFDQSLEAVKNRYKDGHVSKEDFTAALRGHHAAIAATKSPQREEAAEFKKRLVDRERRGI